MADSKPVAVLNKQGQQETESRGKVVVRQGIVGPIASESRADAYLRQKKGSKEAWPGEFEAQAKKYRDEDAEAEAKLSPSPSPSPRTPIKPSPKPTAY